MNEIDAGEASIRVDGKEYQIVTKDKTENKMTYEIAKDSVFEFVSANGTTSYTVKDSAGKQITITGDGSTFTAGKKLTNAAAGTVEVTEDGKTKMTVTFAEETTGKALTEFKESKLTIEVNADATVKEFAETVETMIGTKVFDASIEDSNMVFKTLDTTSLEVTGKIATAFGLDAGKEITLEADDTAESLRLKINALEGIAAEFDENGKLVVKSAEGDDLVISGALAEKLGISGAVTNGSNERAAYAKQFDSVLKQIDELVQDTSYKGINLLKGDNLTVVFNESRTSTLELKGVTFDSTGLGFTASKNEWISTTDIDESLDQITKATSMLRAQASEFGQNLSTVQIREDFTENMINNLTTGADKLTLADANEEAANLLALQTRQSLATNSLSLASQSAQSVLKLF